MQWHDYFGQLLGHTIMNDQELKDRVFAVAPTPQRARPLISVGIPSARWGGEMAKDAMTLSTWYRNLEILKDAGLKVTDLGDGKVIPFKKKYKPSSARKSAPS